MVDAQDCITQETPIWSHGRMASYVWLTTYTHRQKLSKSKLVLNIKKCFIPKYWKVKFYYLHLTSFEKSISVTEQRYYVTSVKAGIYWRGVCFFTVLVWHFVKGSILNRICALVSYRKASDSYLWRIPERICVKKKTHLVKYRSNIWHDLFNKKACQNRLNFETGSVA